MSGVNRKRYLRQTILPDIGAEGQQRLAESSVLIVGLGGLGAPVAAYLTGAGIGRIGLCDADTVSKSNLQRQILYSEAQTGMPKTEAACERLKSMSAHTIFNLHSEGLTSENAVSLVGGYDLVVDCCDNYPTRYLIDDTCRAAGKTWVYGAIGEYAGQVTVFGGNAALHYADIYPDREAMCAQPRRVQGVLGPVPGTIGAIQASEAIKLLAGFGHALDGRMFVLDLREMNSEIINLY